MDRAATRTSALGALAISLTLGTAVSAENWPQWRGPAGTGASTETRVPESWSDTKNIKWKTRLGGVGVSSPIVWGERVFVTSQAGRGASRQGPRLGQGGDTSSGERALTAGAAAPGRGVAFLIDAFNRTNGQRAWTFELASEGDLPSVHDKHNLASASPVTDGERVYAVFGSGQVVAVDMNGKQVWTRNLAKEHAPFDINWGNGSSPVVHGGKLILVCYHEAASYLLALDSRTGNQLWKTDRPKGVLSYSTPVVVPAPDGEELIVNSSAGIEAFDPLTGKSLWHFDEANQFPIPVAMHHEGVIYFSRGYRSGPYAAIRPGGRGDISKTHVVWHVPTGAPYISSLVYYDGLLYMAGDVGVITCVDAKTGASVWRERLGGVYTASPVAADGKVFLLSESGETIVLRAGRTPQVIARNKIDGRILASPAISGGGIFIRTDDHVVAVGL
jgi:outer membrane protein assembly factor BamB